MTQELTIKYCESALPTYICLGFKKDVDREYMIETNYPIPSSNIYVMITDIRKDWQLPLAGVKDIGNPKIKEMSLEDFNKTFDVLSYAVKVKDIKVMSAINTYGLSIGSHQGKLKRFHHSQL